MKVISLKTLDKKLEKKNSELVEVREFRKKLDDKEKEICAAIEKIQNQKVEIIFSQVKKEIKDKNLDISSASVLTIVEALQNNQQILHTEENTDSQTPAEKNLSDEESENETSEETYDDFFKKINSISNKNEIDSEDNK